MATKTCTKCKTEKPLTEFRSRGGKQKHLLKSQCNSCLRNQHRQWCADNPERIEEYRKRDQWSLTRRCARYGISPEQFVETFERQEGKCACCGKSITMIDSAIDHNHETGALRGLLCTSCNRGLGLFQDSPSILSKAAAYLLTEGHYGEA